MGASIHGNELTLNVGGVTLSVDLKSGAVSASGVGADASYDPSTGTVKLGAGNSTMTLEKKDGNLIISNGLFSGTIVFSRDSGKISQIELKASKATLTADIVINANWTGTGVVLTGQSSLGLFGSPSWTKTWPISVDMSTPLNFANVTGLSSLIRGLLDYQQKGIDDGSPEGGSNQPSNQPSDKTQKSWDYWNKRSSADQTAILLAAQDIVNQTTFPVTTPSNATSIALGEDGDTLRGYGVLVSGGGNESLVSTGNATLVGNSGNTTMNGRDGSSDTFVYSGITVASGTQEIDTINANGSTGIVKVGATQLIGPSGKGEIATVTSAGTQTTWTVTSGNDIGTQYQFDSNTGNLTISQGLLGTSGGEIIIDNFNMAAAQGGATSPGFLGLQFAPQIDIVSGIGNANAFFNYTPANTSVTAQGETQALTFVVSDTTSQTRTITLALAGGNGSQFFVNTGADLLAFNNGTVTLTIPAGADSVTVGLVYTGDPTQGQSVQLTSTLIDPANAGNNSPVSNFLGITFAPQAALAPVGLSGTTAKDPLLIDGTYYNYTTFRGDGLIVGNSGANSIATGNGNSIIKGSDALNVIITGNGNNQVYANTQTDLATALAARSGSPSGKKGDFISVGDGNNTIVGGNGNDGIFTGTGNNTLVLGSGSVTVQGGVEVSYANADWTTTLTSSHLVWNDVVAASAAFNAPAPYYGGIFAGVPVGLGNDTIYGGAGNSFYYLSNGNNYLDAGGGNDNIWAGVGQNTIFGGTGNDTIFGGGGNNYINAESGSDFIVANGGNSTIIGGSGSDTIYSGNNDASWATSIATENTYISGGSGNSKIYGAGGNDTLIGGTGNSTIYGGDGNEYIVGGTGNVSINGGAGNDTIYSGDGQDSVFAGTGNTTIYGGNGIDYLAGGSGKTLIYAGDGGTADNFTQIVAGSGDTTIYGGNGIDHIFGGSGNNAIYAGDGGTGGFAFGETHNATYVQAGSGGDTLYGGNGTAELDGRGGSYNYAVTIYGGGGNNELVGGKYFNTLIAGTGNQFLVGGTGENIYVFNAGFGNDTIGSDAGNSGDSLQFGAGISASDITASMESFGGSDELLLQDGAGSIAIANGLAGRISNIEFADGSRMGISQLINQAYIASVNTNGDAGGLTLNGGFGADSIVGGAGNDTINGWWGNDTLTAGSGNTVIHGGAGDTVIYGGAGNDTLYSGDGGTTSTLATVVAGSGNDTIYGGAGNNLFVFNQSFGNDVIAAGGGVDTLQFGTGILSSDLTFTVSANNDVVIHDGVASSVTISSATVGQIGQINFADGSSAALSHFLPGLTINGDAAGLNIIGSAGDDSLVGGSGNDTISSLDGNDTLVAGTGVATLIGGNGNDLFVLNNTGDVITKTGRGVSSIQTSVSYALPDDVQNITGTGSADLRLTGNSLANVIKANSGNDSLVAGIGNDTLIAGTGNDTLVGGSQQEPTNSTYANTGSATYVINAGSGKTTITNSAGTDVIQFGSGILASNVTASATLGGDGTAVLTLQIAGGNSVVVKDGLLKQANFADGSYSTYSFDSQGDVTVNNYAPAANSATNAEYVYVVNSVTSTTPVRTISEYTVGVNGELVPMATPAVSTQDQPAGISIDPTGTYAYVTSAVDLDVTQYTIGANGALTPSRPLRNDQVYGYATDFSPGELMVDASGKHAYVLNTGSATISEYTVDASGAFGLMASLALGNSGALSLALDPSGQFAYVTDSSLNGTDVSHNTVLEYTIDGNGVLKPMSISSVTTGSEPSNITLDPSGKYAYVTNYGDNTVSQYTIGANGILTPMATPLVNTGFNNPTKLVIDPSGKFAYVINQGSGRYNDVNIISQFTIGVDGALAAMDVPNVTLTGIVAKAMTIDPSGKYVYVISDANQVLEYGIGANGQLNPMAMPALATGSGASSIISISKSSTTPSNVLTSDSWSHADGSSGSDVFNADGTGSGTVHHVDGSSSSYTISGGAEVTAGSISARPNATSLTGIGIGNIILSGNTLNEVITANGGNDTLVGGYGTDTMTGATIINIPLFEYDPNFTTGYGVDTLVGGTGNDTFVVNNAADMVIAQAGSNINTVMTSVSLVAPTNVSVLTAIGSTNIILTGNSLNDVITGGFNDTLVSGSGVDTLIGNGRSTFIINNTADVVQENSTALSSQLETSANYVLPTNITMLTGLGSGDISLTGNTQTDVITANSGNDTLIAGSGLATLVGGAGNDTFVVNNTKDVVTQISTSGVNVLQTSVSYVLPSNVQNITGAGTGNLALTGNTMVNVITANSGNDTLIAGSGLATLVGGTGNDTFVLNNAADVIEVQSTGTNVNTVQTSFSYVAPTNVQKVTLTGSADLTVTGNALANTLTANTGNDTLIAGSGIATLVGGNGNDTFIVNNAADVVQAKSNGTNVNTLLTSVNYVASANLQNITLTGTASLSVTGSSAKDVIVANSGNDTLTSGSGVATLVGGTGNDTFVINNVADVVQAQSTGSNSNVIQSSVSYVAAANVQSITATGKGNIALTGNNLDNTITGNSGNDTLTAGSGNDTLIAGSGVSTLVGGTGNTTFVVNNTADVVQATSTGTNVNTVTTSVNFVTPAKVQNITGSGAGNLTLTGNTLTNAITANTGNDTLIAGAGVATLIGGTGNDTFVINNVADVIQAQSTGTNVNTVQSSVSYVTPANVQKITLTGTGNLTATGNSLADTLTANTGNDTLIAGTGIATLVGGTGNDTFVVNNVADVVQAKASGSNVNTVLASVNYVAPTNVLNITLTGTADLTATGNTLKNVVTANSGNDTLTAGSGVATLVGGTGNDTFVVNNVADVIQAQSTGSNSNAMLTSVSYVLPANVQSITGTGTGILTLTGNTLDDVINANSGSDSLIGGSGNSVLDGGAGNDHLTEASGNGVLLGGGGTDVMTGGSGRNFMAGGTGNDTLTMGSGSNIIAFNKGDGQDAVTAAAGTNNTISLGGNFAYSDLTFQKSGNNLILNMGTTEHVTLQNWYTGSNKVTNLQVIDAAMSDFNHGSSDVLRNSNVENFNFQALVTSFNQALTANPQLTSWALTNALLTDHLSSSDTAALGGDLAYEYGLRGNLTGFNVASAQAGVSDTQFATTPQTLHPWGSVSGAAAQIR